MSFTNTPVTKFLVSSLVAVSLLTSLLDAKHYFYILVDKHIWKYGQLWRFLAFQLCYANSAEVLFAAMAFYHLRTIERLWGSRKYASFLLTSYLLTSILTPTLLTLLISPLTAHHLSYLPAGPTPILFSVLAQYHSMVPHLYQFRLALPTPSSTTSTTREATTSPSSTSTTTGVSSSSSSSSTPDQKALTFSDKSYKYILTLHLSLTQFPSSLLPALTGWLVGHLYRADLLPPSLTQWRIPPFFLGLRHAPRRQEFEGLQRRLAEGEGGAVATGVQSGGGAGGAGGVGGGEGAEGRRRRNLGGSFMEQFRGAF